MMKYILAFLGVFLALSTHVSAARIILEPQDSGRQVDVLIAAEGTELNGVEGDIAIQGNVEDVETAIANSIVPFWVEDPTYANGFIHFGGIIPGGFDGLLVPDVSTKQPALLFSVSFNPVEKAKISVISRNSSILLHDGLGTEVSLPLSQISFISTPRPSSTPTSKDTFPPSSFVPAVAKDDSIFQGRFFAVWNTVDRDSGIDHYEIREYRPGKNVDWVRADSPYELKDQELKSAIDVKAVDKAGNERIGHLDATDPLSLKDLVSMYGILYVFLFVLIASMILWLRTRKHDNEEI
jgi:hypothetical protein